MSHVNPPSDMQQFPIRELSARTQVNTVTIRAWERRYGLLNPARTSKGHRLYSSEDVTTIEKILSLVARGVPLGKVKPLLSEEAPSSATDDSDSWNQPIEHLITAIRSFNPSQIEHLIDEIFLNYPSTICRTRLIEPSLEALSQDHGSKAAYTFAEGELTRYALLRLSAKTAKKSRNQVLLLSGEKAPLWRLSLMAMELSDAHYKVQFICRPFSVAAGLEIAATRKDVTTVFYQDGLWKEEEGTLMADALSKQANIRLCGTAAILAGLANNQWVFADVDSCIVSFTDKSRIRNACVS